MAKKLAIVLANNLNNTEMAKYHRDKSYIWFSPTKTFVLRNKLREIKELLDEGKTVAQVNEIIN